MHSRTDRRDRPETVSERTHRNDERKMIQRKEKTHRDRPAKERFGAGKVRVSEDRVYRGWWCTRNAFFQFLALACITSFPSRAGPLVGATTTFVFPWYCTASGTPGVPGDGSETEEVRQWWLLSPLARRMGVGIHTSTGWESQGSRFRCGTFPFRSHTLLRCWRCCCSWESGQRTKTSAERCAGLGWVGGIGKKKTDCRRFPVVGRCGEKRGIFFPGFRSTA